MTGQPPYVLGSGEGEIARLAAHAAMPVPAARSLLEAGGGTSPGMRVTSPTRSKFTRAISRACGPVGPSSRLEESDAVLLPPTLVGAWGTAPAAA